MRKSYDTQTSFLQQINVLHFGYIAVKCRIKDHRQIAADRGTISIFTAFNSKSTGPMFTKCLYDVLYVDDRDISRATVNIHNSTQLNEHKRTQVLNTSMSVSI